MLDIIIVIGCSMCGFAVGIYLERRARTQSTFYSDLTKYVELFGLNIEAKQMPLNVFNENFAATSSSVFADYLTQNKLQMRLSSSQKKDIDSFFADLGSLGSQELTKHILYYKGVFASRSKEAADKWSKASIYPKLGVLLGVMVGILLI